MGPANSDVNLLFGIESRIGWMHPYGEAKLLIYDRTQFALIGGVNVTLGGR